MFILQEFSVILNFIRMTVLDKYSLNEDITLQLYSTKLLLMSSSILVIIDIRFIILLENYRY
jgi:hypothetical protein